MFYQFHVTAYFLFLWLMDPSTLRTNRRHKKNHTFSISYFIAANIALISHLLERAIH